MLKGRIKSADIDTGEFSEESLRQLHRDFPLESLDTLARYLIARKDDFRAAAEQLRRAQKWQERHCPILKRQCISEIQKGKVYVRGVDKEGRPLLVITSRLHNPNERDVHEMLLMTLWFTEIAIARMPPHMTKFTVLIDREGYEHAGDSEFMQLLSEVFQDVYPERLHRAVVYPSGFVYYAMWHGLIKWFMDQRTRDKVYPAMQLADVEAVIDRQYIPAAMGGDSGYIFSADDYEDPVAERSPTEEQGPCDSVCNCTSSCVGDEGSDSDVWHDVDSDCGDDAPAGETECESPPENIVGALLLQLWQLLQLLREYLFPSIATTAAAAPSTAFTSEDSRRDEKERDSALASRDQTCTIVRKDADQTAVSKWCKFAAVDLLDSNTCCIVSLFIIIVSATYMLRSADKGRGEPQT